MPALSLCGGIMPQVDGVGKRILAGRRGGRVLQGSANAIDSDGASLYCPAVYVAQVSNNAHGTGPPHVAGSREFVDTPGDRKAVISPRCGLRRSSCIDSKFRIPVNSKWEAHSELSPPVRARFAAISGGRRATHAAGKC